MRIRRGSGAALGLLLAGTLGGCAGGDSANQPVPDDGLSGCALDTDCPTGLICQAAACVNPDDLLPPDVEASGHVARPQASAGRLFTLAPDSDALLVMDPATLDIQTVPVASGPASFAVLPGQAAAVVLSPAARALTRVTLAPVAAVSVTRLARRYAQVVTSPDGRWALLWNPASTDPDAEDDGVVAVVDLEADGAPAYEAAAGFRLTDVHFVTEAGVATRVAVVGKGSVTHMALSRLAEDGYRPQRILLPPAFAEVIGREVVAQPGAPVLLMRSLGEAALAVVDVVSSTVAALPLPARATDLDLSPTGDFAVAALRGAGQVAVLPIPEILSSTAAMRLFPVSALSPGQVEVAADGAHAAVFTTADDDEVMGWLDLTQGDLQVVALEKAVAAVAIGPDSSSALVVHRPVTSSVADDYERMVDADEGYSLVDLGSGFVQLARTHGAPPQEVVFGASGRYAAVTVRDDDAGRHRVEAADFMTMVVRSHDLASTPRYAGALPDADAVWIIQEHPAGRISVLDPAGDQLRTLTGFQLNAEIVATGGGE
ncbi:MAG: hypothetical protein H6730_28700 [Deltaproteobacteria bacterium]|nr:hypothetical protein [Deltaproteobacteria bacterium]